MKYAGDNHEHAPRYPRIYREQDAEGVWRRVSRNESHEYSGDGYSGDGGGWRPSWWGLVLLLCLMALAAVGVDQWRAHRARQSEQPPAETAVDGVLGGPVESTRNREEEPVTGNGPHCLRVPLLCSADCRCGPCCDCGPDCDCTTCCDAAVLSGGQGVVDQDDYGQLLERARARRDTLRRWRLAITYGKGLVCVLGGVAVVVLVAWLLGPKR